MAESVTPQFRYSVLLREIDEMLGRGAARIALVLVHVDGVADVNARFGYMAGDKLVEEFARRLAAVARPVDRVVRLSGATHALLIHEPLHEGHAVLAAERLAREAAEPVVFGAGRSRLKAHCGISLLPDPAVSGEDLLQQGEVALAVARQRDEGHTVFTDALAAGPLPRAHPWFDIDEAVRDGEFQLLFQPKVALRTGRPCGAEALVRWRGPDGVLVSPPAFLPAIEQGREVHVLFRFVLNSALRIAGPWARALDGFDVAVNVSPGNLEDADLADLLAEALELWSFPAGRLVLGVTETTLMRDPAASAATLERLATLGVRAAIDDFGTGYSSLAYLRDIPAAELKIDRSFVTGIADNENNRRIVGSVIQLAHAMDMRVVGEGVECADEARVLTAMGCEAGQGFYFAPPLPAERFGPDWITRYVRSA